MIGMYFFILVVVTQRIVEVIIANRNARWIKDQGGYEVGKDHYKWIVLIHVFFFVSLIFEVTLTWDIEIGWSIVPLIIFLLAQIMRVWALFSLGRFWNTRIMVLPMANIVKKGPYRFIRHPNYVIVMIELAILPLIWHAYWTAVVFTILNWFVLSIRIKEEEKALMQLTNYEERHKYTNRFIPRRPR